MKYGLYDTKDHLWIGDNIGPKTFDSESLVDGEPLGELKAKVLARVAAEIADIRLGWRRGRIQVRELDCPSPKEHDELPLSDTTLNVLRKLERGTIV